jgi:hypothetical protein
MTTKTNPGKLPGTVVVRPAIGTALILLIPVIAMQFSEEWDWRAPDFIIIGTLLFSAGLVYELLIRKVASRKHRLAYTALLVATVMLLWAELAVGIFTTLGS